MTVHVLHAGNGYTYLTRQVAHGDVGRERGKDLADYYAAKGAPPGIWLGSGVAALDVQGHVSETQMQALFGEGMHPDADRITTEALTAGATPAAAVREAQLGRRFPTFDTAREEAWRSALAERLELRAREAGVPSTAAPRELRAAVRREVGTEWFVRDRGREPLDEGELKKHIVQCSKPTPQPVAGYDLVFTPAKSISVLWGVGDDATRRTIEAAHKRAVADALGYLESEALFTRTGAGGVAQVNAQGLIGAAFDHYDSRSGDPNFHTHVAVANKVQGPDGNWRSIDGRVLHAAAVSASERYNAYIERELIHELGVAFEEREAGIGKRPVREVAGVDQRLLTEFSQRRNAIEERFDELRSEYRLAHGHEPSKATQHQLAQQATLDTRDRKEELESLAEKRGRWLPRAAAVIGDDGLAGLVDQCRERAQGIAPAETSRDPRDLADRVVHRVSVDRSRWKVWHLRAEAERHVRTLPGLSTTEARDLVDQVTAAAVDGYSVLLEPPDDEQVPAELSRRNGESVFRVHGAQWLSSPAVLRAEDRLLDAAATPVVPVVDGEILEAFTRSRDTQLDPGQRDLVRHFATTDRLVAVGVGAAGSGKSTAMAELAAAVDAVGRRVVAVAPSAVAAQELGDKIGSPATTIAKLLHTAENQGPHATGLRAGDMLLVDEAGMASTRDLDRLVDLAKTQGCVVRLLGDPQQLAAVEAGGAFRLLVNRTPAAQLVTLHRFVDPAEAQATLGVRDGDTAALDFYVDAGRLHSGSRDGILEQVYADWRNDQVEGKASIMLATDSATVRELATRARLDRIADGEVSADGLRLHDGTTAGAGDVIVTRRNDRRLATAGGRDFVKNGDLWRIKSVGGDGSLTVWHTKRAGAPVRLPAAYVAQHVELGYALTVHRAQGVTVDRARVVVDDSMTREAYYVASTRGREENHAYVVTEAVVDVDMHHPTDRDRDARHVLEDVLGREGADRSATETMADAYEAAESLSRLIPEYEHARGAAAAHSGRVDQVLVDALGEPGLEQLREDPAWHALADRIASLEDEGRDAGAVVGAAVARGDLDDAKSVAAVITWRINEGAQRGGLETWSTREPAGAATPEPSGSGSPSRAAAGTMDGWLDDRRERIRRRVDDLAERTLQEQPEWLVDAVGGTPEAGSEREDRYRAAARAAAVYRDRYGVTDSRHPLGHEPTDGRQRRDWHRAYDALRAARPDDREPPGPGSRGRRQQDLAERARLLRERAERSQARSQARTRDLADERSEAARQREEQQRRTDELGRDDLEL